MITTSIRQLLTIFLLPAPSNSLLATEFFRTRLERVGWHFANKLSKQL